MIDNNLTTAAAALPNAANTTATAVLGLPQRAVRPFTNRVRVRLTTTEGTGANTKNITISLQASNESNGANSANITGLGPLVITEATSKYAPSSIEWVLPPEANKNFLIAKATGEADGGNAANGSMTLQIID